MAKKNSLPLDSGLPWATEHSDLRVFIWQITL